MPTANRAKTEKGADSKGSAPKISPVPTHVAIIMDGNGRWAEKRGLTRFEGHRAGTENIRRIIRSFAGHGVKYLTLYAFSTENWNRPDEEVKGLFRILADVIDRELKTLHEEGVKLVHIGSLEGLSEELKAKVKGAIELTKNNRRLVLNVAFNYGGRADILNAVRRIMAEGIPPEKIDESVFSRYLYTNGTPDPDLIIRTGDEMRLSNFLIWQAAYAEFYSIPTFWPDFDEKDVVEALTAYSQRERRFGGLGPNGKRRGAHRGS
ncbi:MAG: di-trans,poly-cis-decaprenylcistransferase [Chloroflexi bacterium]|nr:di-trans,poly-cis-decaprenylcistransferase [Chloroflexota bacterium]